MKRIHITRDASGTVVFETVSIDVTQTVFFTNLDTEDAHHPDIASNELGAAPSPNSSQCTVPAPTAPATSLEFKYGCKLHPKEQGIINVYLQLAAVTTPALTGKVGQLLTRQVVSGGKPQYLTTEQIFQVLDASGNVLQSGTGVGPGLLLDPFTGPGITITGIPTIAGTYKFSFTVNDAMVRNLQQVQYSLAVSA